MAYDPCDSALDAGCPVPGFRIAMSERGGFCDDGNGIEEQAGMSATILFLLD